MPRKQAAAREVLDCIVFRTSYNLSRCDTKSLLLGQRYKVHEAVLSVVEWADQLWLCEHDQ